MEQTIYDCIIVGGGPAGVTAGIYTKRAGLKTLIIEKYAIGGQILITSEISNYPGFSKITGEELGEKFKEQLKSLKTEIIFDEVYDCDLHGEVKVLKTIASGDFYAKSIVLAMGTDARKLTLPKEMDLIGSGISYCAVCDGNFFKNKTVAVVGGGNSAIEDVLYMSNVAKKTYLIHRNNNYRAEKIRVETLENKQKSGEIEVILNSEVTKLFGEHKLEGVEITNKLSNEKHIINLDGLFIAIGRTPQSDLSCKFIDCDNQGFIVTDDKLQTNIKGIFAVGDIRSGTLKQIVNACADGSLASMGIIEYVRSLKKVGSVWWKFHIKKYFIKHWFFNKNCIFNNKIYKFKPNTAKNFNKLHLWHWAFNWNFKTKKHLVKSCKKLLQRCF